MKPLPLLLAILLAAGGGQPAARAALPSLTVKSGGDDVALELRSLTASVELTGDIAETVLELEFFNHTRRMREGEFTLQLPEGATVSIYALEVAGAMRPGVAVEKEQARFAYESIKRRMVDPGLVEREGGNRYRTRIFPIEALASKRVRIGYLQWLGGEPYRFAFDQGSKLRAFSCRVAGAAAAELETPGLARETDPARREWSWKGEDLSLRGELKVTPLRPRVGEPIHRIEREPDGAVHFVIQGRLPQGWRPQPRPRPERVRVIWDASLSGRSRDHERELAALEAYLKWAGETRVEAVVLRHRLEEAGTFEIAGGDAGALTARLREIEFDGAADFSRIEAYDGVTLLFTDGEMSSPAWALPEARLGEELHVMDSLGIFGPRPGLPGERVDLTADDALEALTTDRLGVAVAGLSAEHWQADREGERYTVTGRVPAGQEGGAVEILRAGAEPSRVDLRGEEVEWGFARRVWAERQLAALESRGDAPAILAFAQAERLVSDYTSLIVLEQFSDHVQYRIPPPEPDQLARYEEALAGQARQRSTWLRDLWRGKEQWHGATYPWLDLHLAEEAAAVSVWVKASRNAFPEDKLNREPVQRFAGWLPEAEKVIAGKETLRTREEFELWRGELGRVLAELLEIRQSVADPAENEPVHVSVRGFVNRRGIHTGQAPLMLEDAIRLAGGPRQSSSRRIPWLSRLDRSRVYLYRNAVRTGYNLESDRYRSVPLRWGDMIVLELPPEPDWLWADSFSAPADPFMASGGADGAMRSGTPASAEAVFEEPGSRRHFDPGSATQSLPRSPGEGAGTPPGSGPALGIRVAASDPAELPAGVDEQIVEAFRDSGDLAAIYREHARGPFREALPSPATVVEIARLLFARGEPELGERALSNWLEWLPDKIEATRALAAWLAECGAADRAAELLEALAASVPDPATRILVLFDLARLRGGADAYRVVLEGLAELRASQPELAVLAAVALTDYFAAEGKAEGAAEHLSPRAMRSDLRIVVSSSGDDIEMRVREPGVEWHDGRRVSPHGGRMASGLRVHEYQMRRGLPGAYVAICRRQPPDPGAARGQRLLPVTLRVTWYTRWGSEGEESVTRTLLLEDEEISLDAVEFAFPEGNQAR